MKNLIKFVALVFLLLTFILHSCKKEELPTISTSTITNITATTATSGGNITSDGGAEVTARGVCWGLNADPTISDSNTNDGDGIGQFVSAISGLNGGSTYHIRGYATNSVGTAYGADITFTTLGQAPSATTQVATNVTATYATINAIVNANHLSTIVTFDYGITTSYGQTITATPSPVTGNSNINATAELSGLAAGTTYHFRVKTVNSLGTTNGNDLSFTTLGQAPNAITQAACCLSTTGAKLNGTVNANYVSTSVTFEYGLTTSYGSSIAATPSPVTGNSATSVSAGISGLNSGTTYHFRIKAENSLGTTYGNDLYFETILTDVDGNIYNTVLIGNQVWMAENLKTTKLNDGTSILYIPNGKDWYSDASTGELRLTPAYCWYANDEASNRNTYGALYNWYTVNTGKLCPTGWHVPTDSEWSVLTSHLGGESIAGGKLIEVGTSHWELTNPEITNETGFTALPGGFRYGYGDTPSNPAALFYGKGLLAYMWTSSVKDAYSAWWREMAASAIYVFRNSLSFQHGCSVRCLKD